MLVEVAELFSGLLALQAGIAGEIRVGTRDKKHGCNKVILNKVILVCASFLAQRCLISAQ